MKHVWILNHYAQLPEGVGSIRHFGLADSLKEQGWSAIVIAASVEHMTGRQRMRGFALCRLRKVLGFQWLWLRTPVYSGNGIGRVFNMIVYSLVALLPHVRLGLVHPDLIIGSSVHPFAAWAGALLAKRYRVPFVFEVRDLWPSTFIDMGKIRSSSLVARVLFWLERWLVKRSALIITLMPRAGEYYQKLGVDADRILVLPNGAEVSVAVPRPVADGDGFALMYCGAMGDFNSLETLLDALARVERDWDGSVPFKCRMIGDGPAKSKLKLYAEALGLKSVVFEAPVPKSEVSALLLEANAFVLTVKDMPRLYRFGVSMNKIFDYMAAGRPTIMAADVPDNPIELSGGGVVVPPESPADLARAILDLSQSAKEEREVMGRRAWKYVLDHHDYSNLAKCLASAMDKILIDARHREQ